jgi:hypothetical protein
MNQSIKMALRAALCAALSGCSDLPPPPIGQLRLGLSSGIGDAQYKLVNASFAIEGTAQLTLSSDDEPESDTLLRALPAGAYSVELLEGWQLERHGSMGSQQVPAELSSDNPLSFSITAGALTTLTFQFKTGAPPPVQTSDGQLRVNIEVDGVGSPQVVISELMKNPEVLPDADGEWIELYNAGTEPLALGGCILARDEQELELESGFVIEAGGHLTFSNGEAPGFQANVLYSGITLPNTGAFVLRLACGEHVLDAVNVDPAALPNRAGRSLSRSGPALDSDADEVSTSWCEGVTSYNGDFGTPGAANPPCAP